MLKLQTAILIDLKICCIKLVFAKLLKNAESYEKFERNQKRS